LTRCRPARTGPTDARARARCKAASRSSANIVWRRGSGVVRSSRMRAPFAHALAISSGATARTSVRTIKYRMGESIRGTSM